MKKIYILTIIDLRNNGYNCKDVKVYTDKASAIEEMRNQYLEKFKELHDADEDPYAPDTMDYQFDSSYVFVREGACAFAYLFGEYYWDIFEREV